jgi:hypothetical protein
VSVLKNVVCVVLEHGSVRPGAGVRFALDSLSTC